jgi:hypothetical protein
VKPSLRVRLGPGKRRRYPTLGTQIGWAVLLWLVTSISLVARGAPAVVEETVRILGPIPGMKLGLRHAGSGAREPQRPVALILPGAAVPVSGNPDYPFNPGRSLMTALAESGLDVWALD